MIKKIKILGHEYRVIFDAEKASAQTVGVALVNFPKQEIYFNPTYSETRVSETLLHEIIEIINYHFALGLEHDKQLTALSEVLHSVLMENFGIMLK